MLNFAPYFRCFGMVAEENFIYKYFNCFFVMKEADFKGVADMQLARFVKRTNGLRMTEMRVVVLGFMEVADKFVLLDLIDDIIDELGRGGRAALGPHAQGLSKRQALLLLGDLRRWFVVHYCYDAVECCNRMRELSRRVAVLEAEKARMNDGWSDRVTYENMVEKIAAYEDASERDNARNLIEPMLKRDMARRFREDIKAKMKELNGDEGGKEIHNHFEAGSTAQVFNG